MAMTEKERHLLDRMRALCSRREYCTGDIRRKVIEALKKDAAGDGFSPLASGSDAYEAAGEIISALVSDKYIDDMRYAAAFACDKAAIAGWGRVRIRHALEMKGIPGDMIKAALQEIDAGRADERLARLIENKYRSLKDDPMCRIKLIRFALGRGYEYDEVRSVIEKIC